MNPWQQPATRRFVKCTFFLSFGSPSSLTVIAALYSYQHLFYPLILIFDLCAQKVAELFVELSCALPTDAVLHQHSEHCWEYVQSSIKGQTNCVCGRDPSEHTNPPLNPQAPSTETRRLIRADLTSTKQRLKLHGSPIPTQVYGFLQFDSVLKKNTGETRDSPQALVIIA